MLFFLLLPISLYSQQNEEFLAAQHYFSNQRKLLQNEFTKKIIKESDSVKKNILIGYFGEFMHKLDSIENRAYIATLVRVKNREDLYRLNNKSVFQQENKSEIKSVKPEYPGGENSLKEKIAERFYPENLKGSSQEFSTRLNFTVNEDGSISNVDAEGLNQNFNTQAIIATYLLPEKFRPAMLKGVPVKYDYFLTLVLGSK